MSGADTIFRCFVVEQTNNPSPLRNGSGHTYSTGRIKYYALAFSVIFRFYDELGLLVFRIVHFPPD